MPSLRPARSRACYGKGCNIYYYHYDMIIIILFIIIYHYLEKRKDVGNVGSPPKFL